jgi:4-amino-4-deoxy-L-arabinose transferase-like glycosyltransferase
MFRTSKYKKIILISVFVLAAFLICFHFTDTPKVWVDEGVFTETAKNLATHGILGLQTEPGKFFPMNNFLLSTGYPVILPVAGSFMLFGTGIWQARLPMLIYMFLLFVVFYLFVKKKYGFSAAILSVLLLLSFSPFYGNGRPVQGEVPGLFFMVLGSWFLLLWEGSAFQNKKWALFSGLALGLAAATKPIFLLGVSATLVISLFFWFKKIGNKKALYLCGLGFILPVFFWCLIHLPNIGEVSKFFTYVLYFSGNHGSGIPLSQTVITNLLKFFTESTPVLFLLLLLTIIFSVGYRYYKKTSLNASISEFFIFSFIILNWLGFLAGTGWYRYFFPAHVLVYLLFPAAILATAEISNKKFLKKSLFMIPFVLIILQFFHLVFLSDTSFAVKRTRNAELSAALSQISPSQKVLFDGHVEAIIFLKGDNYSQYLNMGDFLVVGNKNAMTKPSEDFILTDSNREINEYVLSCYDKKPVNSYLLFQKIIKCKK